MKLMIAIIEDQYANEIIKTLMENKVRITKLASTGGFLKAGNTTLLIGTKEEDLDSTIALIREKCEVKLKKKNDKKTNRAGANLFILDVDNYMRV
jgi:uncharacterized protein YaaQ